VEGEILFSDDIILNCEEHEILVLFTAAAHKIRRIGICSAESRLLIVYIVAVTCYALLTSSSLTTFSQQQNFVRVPFKLCEKSCLCTGLFEMIVGVLTTCHTQYT